MPIVVRPNDTSDSFQPSTIYTAIERWARQSPENVAIIAEGWPPLTYGRLQAHIDDVIQNLRAAGVGRRDRIAMVAPNKPDTAVAFLAVASASTVVPLNPAYRADEFDFYLTDLNATLLMVPSGIDSPAIAVAEKHSIPVIRWTPIGSNADAFSLQGERRSHPTEVDLPDASDVALILYTSGTTSKPKKVPLTHANLISSARNIVASLALHEKDRCLNVMPLFHIHGLVGGLLSSMIAGSAIVCSSGFDPENFFEWLKKFHPTWYTAVPTIHQAVLTYAPAHRDIVRNSSLRFIRSSSAPLPAPVMQGLEDLFNVPVIEAYGMTEASHQIASNPLPPGKRKRGSVGIATGTHIAIIDERGRYLSAEQKGEIVLRGPSIMKGYELATSGANEAFIDGCFRTGDQGYLDRDGYLFITGRLKEQINRGGEKVSPYEVEAVLLEHPAIAQAVVFPLEHASLGEDVAAAVVLKPGHSIGENELQTYAAVRLADFKVPRRVVVVEEIPKGPTGKLQRIGLAARLGLQGFSDDVVERRQEFVEPRSEIERKLSQIWAEVLRINPIGIHDNFFELGGQSILAAQIINRIRTAVKVELSFMAFFENPTIAEMAKRGEWSKKIRAEEPPATPLSRRPTELLLSPAQQRVWLFHQLDPDKCASNRALAFRLSGALNARILEQCLNEIVRRHEVLRTTVTGNGQPMQVILPSLTVPFSIVDLNDVPANDREKEALRLAREEVRRPFDLARGPLLRAALLRIDSQEHLLTLTTHHIAADGWSDGILLGEMAALYRGFNAGVPTPLRELSMQYADYAQQQRKQLESGALKEDLSYWKSRIKELPGGLDLPRDHPPPPLRNYRGRQHKLILPNELLQSLKELGRREHATLFMTLLAAFKILLSRYTGKDIVSVGVPVAGRNSIDTEHLVGVFINILVLRTEMAGNPTFQELLQQVRKTTLEAQDHQDLPFEHLVAALQAERDLRRQPLFEVMFHLRDFSTHELNLPGLAARPIELDIGVAHYDLELEVVERRHDLECRFIYNSDLFEPATVERMAQHFHGLLQDIAAQPRKRLSALSMLTQAEHRQLLVDWNSTKSEYPQHRCLHQLIETQARKSPDDIAVLFGNRRITYHQLNQQANSIARCLEQLGVGPDMLVGFCVRRSPEMFIGMLGILKAGGAYVPLDPANPDERLNVILSDVQPRVIVTERRFVHRFSQSHSVLLIDELNSAGDNSGSALDSKILPDSLAYAIFTSGSTGAPKGVLVSHRSIVNHTTAMARLFDLRACDRVLQFAPYSFDVAAEEIFPTWATGATLVPSPDHGLTSLGDLVHFIENEAITVLNLPAPLWEEWVSDLDRLPVPSTVRLLIVGTDKVSAEKFLRFRQKVGQRVRLCNAYGLTETTITSTVYEPQSEDHHSPSSYVPIGRPIANTQVYVLDQNLNLAPIGVTGELYIGGDCLARGYLNQPGLTAERFIANPYSTVAGARLYKTGDFGRLLPDGNIEYVGRIDDQVKLRGFRIELGEIETAISRHPAVKESVALVRQETEDPPAGACVDAPRKIQNYQSSEKRLVAYILRKPGHTLNADELRKSLRQQLPEYMVPSAYVFVDSWPLTPNGKINRRALPAPDYGRARLEDFDPPHSPTQKTLADIWAEVLKIQRVGVHDNFFDLGGHSLLATRVMSRLRDVLRIEMPLRLLFEHPTVASMAECIETLLWAAESGSSVNQKSEEREELKL